MVPGSRRRRAAGRSVAVAAVVAALAVLVDVVTKGWAEAGLPGAPVDLGIGWLRLSQNTGAAFSLGDGLPPWVVGGVASTVTVGVVVGIVLGHVRPALPAGLVLGGAVANIVDRVGDGAVTDFLWLGWFPTFNLADTAITLGALGLVWAAWRHDRSFAGAETDAATAPAGTTATDPKAAAGS